MSDGLVFPDRKVLMISYTEYFGTSISKINPFFSKLTSTFFKLFDFGPLGRSIRKK